MRRSKPVTAASTDSLKTTQDVSDVRNHPDETPDLLSDLRDNLEPRPFTLQESIADAEHVQVESDSERQQPLSPEEDIQRDDEETSACNVEPLPTGQQCLILSC